MMISGHKVQGEVRKFRGTQFGILEGCRLKRNDKYDLLNKNTENTSISIL